MSNDSAVLPCSDCRTAIRTYYYALETRPLCARCKVPYAAQIARGSGPGSLRRVILHGGRTALACAVLLGIGVLAFGLLRALVAVGIGYAVGRAVNHASGSFFDTRYRVIAAVFTYVAIGLASLSPAIRALVTAAPTSSLAVYRTPADDVRTGYPDMDIDQLTRQLEARPKVAAKASLGMPRTDHERAVAAQELRSKGFFAIMGTLLVLMITLPLLGNFTFGLHVGVIAIGAIGYGVYTAWEITGNSVGVLLSGPHRVGTGPVAPTHGGISSDA